MGLPIGNGGSERFEIDSLGCSGPINLVGLGKFTQCSLSNSASLTALPMESLKSLFIPLTPSISSTKTMTRRFGPCTPMVSTRSISAVRLGPVIKAIYLLVFRVDPAEDRTFVRARSSGWVPDQGQMDHRQGRYQSLLYSGLIRYQRTSVCQGPVSLADADSGIGGCSDG